MRFLVDTHVWIWMTSGSDRLSRRATDLLMASESELVLSTASAWEAAVKSALGKMTLPRPVERLMLEAATVDRMVMLHIEPRHLSVLTSLPHHHRDPFDRLIIAQCIAERLPVLTHDARFSDYGVALVDPTQSQRGPTGDRVP